MRRSACLCTLVAVVAAAQPSLAAARTDGETRRLDGFFQSSFEAETPQETQVTQAPTPTGEMMSPINNKMTMSQASQQIVSGMVESFLHSEPLQTGELTCLSEGTGTLAGQLATVTSQMVMVFDQVMGGDTGLIPKTGTAASAPAVSSGPLPVGSGSVGNGASDISAKVDSMFQNDASTAKSAASWGSDGSAAATGWGALPSAPLPAAAQTPAPTTAAPTPSPEQAQGMNLFYGTRRLMEVGPESGGGGAGPSSMLSAPALAMEFGFNMKQVMGLSHQMAQKCLKGDALQALDLAAEHMQSMEYVTGHFMANGQDVVEELSSAVLSWKQGDPKGFGTNFGMAARKVLLSKRGSDGMPEGLPGKEVMANVSAGLIQGMFGPGAAMDLKVPGEAGDEDIHVDLHQCVDNNLPFFQSAWSEALWFFAKKDAKVVDDKSKMQWGTAVAFTMMKAPSALKTCGITDEQEEMIMDSVKALGGGDINTDVDFDMSLPTATPFTKDTAETEFALAAQDWSKKNWHQFGIDLGKMLEQAGSTIQQKYYIGANGGLKKRLVQLADAHAEAPASGSLLSLTFLAAVMAMPMVGAAALRLQKARQSSVYGREPLYLETEDIESGSENVAVE